MLVFLFVLWLVGNPALSSPAIHLALLAYENVCVCVCGLLCALIIGMLMQHATVTCLNMNILMCVIPNTKGARSMLHSINL